jgi:hypothetical protein
VPLPETPEFLDTKWDMRGFPEAYIVKTLVPLPSGISLFITKSSLGLAPIYHPFVTPTWIPWAKPAAGDVILTTVF